MDIHFTMGKVKGPGENMPHAWKPSDVDQDGPIGTGYDVRHFPPILPLPQALRFPLGNNAPDIGDTELQHNRDLMYDRRCPKTSTDITHPEKWMRSKSTPPDPMDSTTIISFPGLNQSGLDNTPGSCAATMDGITSRYENENVHISLKRGLCRYGSGAKAVLPGVCVDPEGCF